MESQHPIKLDYQSEGKMNPEYQMKPDQCNIRSFSDKQNAEVHVPITEEKEILEIEKNDQLNKIFDKQLTKYSNRSGRLIAFLFGIVLLIVGRYSVPDIEISCIKDEVINSLQFANDFINTQGNEIFRDAFQFICSFLVDTVFLITMGYWVMYGRNARLPLSLAVFYITRALIQKIWFSPFPSGYYWESPGIPSLVVPYGRGSDFFFSGHSGFLIICASEWHKLKIPKIRNYVIGVAIYTILILLVYRIHYSIDIFTGVIFAEWTFNKIDLIKDEFNVQLTRMTRKITKYFEDPWKKKSFLDQIINLRSNKNDIAIETHELVAQ